MRIHNGQKPFKCDFKDCDVAFSTQGHLTDHKRRHSGERPYICEDCGDKFTRSSTLKIHVRRHTGERPYKCDKCSRAFSESGNLRTHERTHVKIYNFIIYIIGIRL
jgi:KRAB domain-containing zinc finger protein